MIENDVPKINTASEPRLDRNGQPLPPDPGPINVSDSDHELDRPNAGSGVRPNYTRPFTRGE